MEFKTFKAAIAKQFERMAKHELFRTGVEKDAMWECYLAAFPPGTNPMFRERTEHDCNCCKGFIRAVGNTVAIIEGQVVSVWDTDIGDPAYQAVADALARIVKAQPVVNAFLHFEGTAGTDKTLIDAIDGVTSFSHFFVNLPKQCVMQGAEIATALGKTRANHDVMKRGLETITDDALTTVLDLIAQNALYRGEEHKASVLAFQRLKSMYRNAPDNYRDAFVWSNLKTVHPAAAMIRNTVIGTLLVDLSEDKDLEASVASFEAKVAPTNYKRPTALVTKAMIENAKKAIAELGLGSALERRYATIEDITVNNILYANRSARRSMKADVFDDLAANVSAAPKSLDKFEDVPIAKFLTDILPRIDSMEIMVENRHGSNFVSLVAPVDPTAKRLFKWDNGFSWSYNGDLADSIKERVKRAGGAIDGDLCCRLAWEYIDDLDFHMREPGGSEIYFSSYLRTLSPNGGTLDLDANGRDGARSDPAENIVYADRRRMRDGIYTLIVNNWNRRSSGVGFEVEIEFDGQRRHIAYDRALRQGEDVTVAQIRNTNGVFEIIESLPSSQTTREVWGVSTQTYRPVNVLMASPNHWDERAVGNKHWFFMLDGCRNDGQARGFFNEFLTEELTAHRKVIEMVGSKMKTEESDRQLSGLGFSSTQRNNVLCRVKGSFSRVINLVF